MKKAEFLIKERLMSRKTGRAVALITAILLLLCSCAGKNTDDNVPTPTLTEAPTAAPTAAPTPTPTPMPDLPADRGEKTVQNTEPVVITCSAITGNFSPYFYEEGTTDAQIVEDTQLKLFAVDGSGMPIAGLNYPCLAYMYKRSGDFSGFPELTEEDKEHYAVYRIVLKEGLTYSDGSPITLNDVFYSIYVLSNRNYHGSCGLGELDIYGMKEYHTQITDADRAFAESVVAAGINPDGTYPTAADISTEEQEQVWSCFDEGGELFAKAIIDYLFEKFGHNAYIGSLLSRNLTDERLEANYSLKTAFAFSLWKYMDKFNYSAMELTDKYGNVYDCSNPEGCGPADLWKCIFTNYGYNLDERTGINYDKISDKRFEEYVVDAYLNRMSKLDRIPEIRGVRVIPEGWTDGVGVTRAAIEVLLSKEQSIRDFNFYVAPSGYYGTTKGAAATPLGAGAYTFESFEDGRAVLNANPGYLLGVPENGQIIYEIERQEEEAE